MKKEYARKLLCHWVNAFSVGSLIAAVSVGVVVSIAGQDVVRGALLGLLIAELSLLPAGYFTWKDVVDQLPKSGDFELVYHDVEFGARVWQSLFPKSPAHFKILLEAVNFSPEPAYLRRIEVTKFNVNSTLLADTPDRFQLVKKRVQSVSQVVEFPLDVGPREREPNLELEVTVQLKYIDAMEFARKLCELQDYEIELTYLYQDMTKEFYEDTIVINESFNEFRKQRIKEWSGDQDKLQYVEAARQAGCA